MKKSVMVLMGIILAGACHFSQAWCAGEDDWKELGIESERGNSSAAEAIGKATAINEKFERAKGRVAEAFGGASVSPETPKKTAAVVTPPAVQKQAVKKNEPEQPRKVAYDSFEPRRSDIIFLKNGQELSGVVVTETTDKGYWVEMNGGKIFFEKSEVIEIKKQ